jgi:hypothetical protein
MRLERLEPTDVLSDRVFRSHYRFDKAGWITKENYILSQCIIIKDLNKFRENDKYFTTGRVILL